MDEVVQHYPRKSLEVTVKKVVEGQTVITYLWWGEIMLEVLPANHFVFSNATVHSMRCLFYRL